MSDIHVHSDAHFTGDELPNLRIAQIEESDTIAIEILRGYYRGVTIYMNRKVAHATFGSILARLQEDFPLPEPEPDFVLDDADDAADFLAALDSVKGMNRDELTQHILDRDGFPKGVTANSMTTQELMFMAIDQTHRDWGKENRDSLLRS